MINEKQNAHIVYFLTRSLFLGFGISILCSKSGKDTYIGALLGVIIGLLFTFIYSYIIKNKGNKKLLDILKENKKIGLITRIILFISSFLILLYTLVIYKIFVTSFLLVNTPEMLVTIPWIILASYLAFKGLKIINRVATSLLPLSIILVISSVISLVGYFDIDHFLPILTTNTGNIFITALFFAGISAFPNILSLHLDSNIKDYNKMYILACLFIIAAIISVNGVFGEKLVDMFRFPEYMVLKQMKLFNFIEKVENILSIAWAFDLFLTSSMAIYSIKELLPKKRNHFYVYSLLIILIIIVHKVFATNYINELRIYYLLPYISLIISVSIIILMLYMLKKKSKS